MRRERVEEAMYILHECDEKIREKEITEPDVRGQR